MSTSPENQHSRSAVPSGEGSNEGKLPTPTPTLSQTVLTSEEFSKICLALSLKEQSSIRRECEQRVASRQEMDEVDYQHAIRYFFDTGSACVASSATAPSVSMPHSSSAVDQLCQPVTMHHPLAPTEQPLSAKTLQPLKPPAAAKIAGTGHGESEVPPLSSIQENEGGDEADSNSDHEGSDTTPANEVSLFVQNWVSLGGKFDKDAAKCPRLYPDGDTQIKVQKVNSGKKEKNPRIGWVKETNHKKSLCQGVFVCPHFGKGCYYRERPRLARRHKVGGPNRRKVDGRVGKPPPKSKCPKHPKSKLKRLTCKCWWWILDEGTHWVVDHHGSHDHPAPESAGAADESIEKVNDLLEKNPGLTASELAAGQSGRTSFTPISKLDPKFAHRDYLNYLKKQLTQHINKKMTGSKFGPDSLDGAFFYFSEFEKSDGQDFVVEASLSPQQFIIVASDGMKDLIREAPNPISTDSIEGFVESVFFKGEMNVTVTSTWDPVMQTQVPVLISLLMNKSAESYKIHWDYYFFFYGEQCNSLTDFFDNFPGNTSDTSDAIRLGFNAAIQDYCQEKFVATLSEGQLNSIYRYCEVHFKRNLTRVANVSRAVDPQKKDYFKEKALSLLTIESMDEFVTAMKELHEEFPFLVSWFLWYLQDDRRKVLFPACKNPKGRDLVKFNTLKKDTNAQEGLGGFIQSLAKYKKLGLYYCLRTVFGFITMIDNERELAGCGINVKWKRANKKEKKAGREPARNAKAPESAKRIFKKASQTKTKKSRKNSMPRSPALRSARKSSPRSAPVQIQNIQECCFANSLVQNLISSPPLLQSILAVKSDEITEDGQDKSASSEPMKLLRDFIAKMENHRVSKGEHCRIKSIRLFAV